MCVAVGEPAARKKEVCTREVLRKDLHERNAASATDELGKVFLTEDNLIKSELFIKLPDEPR